MLELSVIDPNRDPAGTATTPFAANSREPIRVETDFFSGHALLLLRPEKPGDDPHYQAHFEASGPRVMEIQALARGRATAWARAGLELGLESRATARAKAEVDVGIGLGLRSGLGLGSG